MDVISEMNNLVTSIDVKGTQEFMGKEIPVVEGGFGEGQKVVLAKTIAEIHETELKEINRLINNNLDEFDFGIDILDLKNGDCKAPLENLGFSNRDISISKNIYLLSEQGYHALVSLMRTEKAKAIRKQLRREYFAMRKVINSDEQLKSNLLLEIYNGGQGGVLASKQLVELERKPLIETIEKQSDAINELKPHAEYAERVLEDKKTTLTPTQIAKDFGMAGQGLNALLHDLGVQYKQNGQWLLYAKYQGKGYTESYQADIPHAKPQTRWTQSGKKFIHDILRENGYKTLSETKQEQQHFDFN